MRDPIIETLRENPVASSHELVRQLRPDALGSHALVRRRGSGRLATLRAQIVSDQAWRDRQPHLARLAEVRHKKISSLLEFGRYDDIAYTIHDYVDGRRLAEILAERGQLSLSEFVPIVSQISMGVADAHLRGLVVGGVRPENVTLFEHDGRALVVKLRDFGLSALPGTDVAIRGVTDEPSDFWAPEADRLADPSSDVFALAALCVRMLDGALPTFDSAADRSALLRARLEPLKRVNASLPDAFIELLRRSLDPDPSLRPADANALFEELIDAVPMSAFRLPRVGQDSPRDLFSSPPSASMSAMTLLAGRWGDEPEEEPPSPSPRPLSAPLPSPSPRPRRRGWIAAVAALVVVATGTTLGLAAGSSAQERETQSMEPAPVAVGHAPVEVQRAPERSAPAAVPIVEAPTSVSPPPVVEPPPRAEPAAQSVALPTSEVDAPQAEPRLPSSTRRRSRDRRVVEPLPRDEQPEAPRAVPARSRSAALLGRDSAGGIEPSAPDDGDPLLSRSSHN
ncbi:MAG: protein kinase [Myxococcota bacterium]